MTDGTLLSLDECSQKRYPGAEEGSITENDTDEVTKGTLGPLY